MNNIDYSKFGGKRISSKDYSSFGGRRISPIENPEESVVVPPLEDLSALERVGQVARGGGTGLAALGDFINHYGASPLLNLLGGAAQVAGKGASYLNEDLGNLLEEGARKAYEARDHYKDSHIQRDVENLIDENTGGKLKPTDTLGNILHTGGEFLTPGAALKGLKVAKTALPMQALESTLGSTAIHALPDITGNKTIDDFLKGLVGMRSAGKLNPETEKRLMDFISREGGEKTPLSQKVAGKALSLGAKPDEELLKNATEVGVELPTHLKLNSPLGQLTENVISKSIFSSPSYKKQQKEAHKSFIDAFEDKVNRIHGEPVSLENASRKAQDAFRENEPHIAAQAEDLYRRSYNTLSPEDVVRPSKTLNVAHRQLEDAKNIPSPSEGTKFLKPKVESITEKWGPSSSEKTQLEEMKKTLSPQAFEQIEKEVGLGGKELSPHTLASQRSALLKDLRERSTLKGARKELSELVDALNEDIGTVGEKNPHFIEPWKKANKFYAREYADTVKSKLGDAILKGDPKEITKYMNTPSDIKKLSNTLRHIPEYESTMNALKRAKYQDLVVDKIKNADGSLSYSNFANLYTKRSKLDPLLKEVGGSADESMRKLAKIAQSYVKSGKDIANPSGTAITHENLNAMGQAMHLLLSGGLGSLGGIKSAGISLASPYILTKLMSNQKYVDQAVKYARARNNKKMRADALGKMDSIFKHEILGKNILKSSSSNTQEE